MLVAMASGYLDSTLRTTPYFRNLEQTEKVGVSFLLGEAFTHWYAQSRMNIEFLVHVAGLSTCAWVTPAAPMVPKAGASAPLLKSRPDFIGIRRREWHVFESKGRLDRRAQQPSPRHSDKSLHFDPSMGKVQRPVAPAFHVEGVGCRRAGARSPRACRWSWRCLR